LKVYSREEILVKKKLTLSRGYGGVSELPGHEINTWRTLLVELCKPFQAGILVDFLA
jgi:hypothetical protein